MIPQAAINAWRNYSPWQTDEQVEQDLVLSRILVEIFANDYLKSKLAFRGGTALHKLYLFEARRYSEDIDLVQTDAEPIGKVLDNLRDIVNPILGEPKLKQNHGRVVLIYRFESESTEKVPLRLKIEINTREHYSFLGYIDKQINVDNIWFKGKANSRCFKLEELLSTKLRALYQRKKGRDLYDIFVAHNENADLNFKKVVTCFLKYLEKDGTSISRAQFEENLVKKSTDKIFVNDINPLLKGGYNKNFDTVTAFDFILKNIIGLIPGKPWSGKI